MFYIYIQLVQKTRALAMLGDMLEAEHTSKPDFPQPVRQLFQGQWAALRSVAFPSSNDGVEDPAPTNVCPKSWVGTMFMQCLTYGTVVDPDGAESCNDTWTLLLNPSDPAWTRAAWDRAVKAAIGTEWAQWTADESVKYQAQLRFRTAVDMVSTDSPAVLQSYLDKPGATNGRVLFTLMRLNAAPNLYSISGEQAANCARCGAAATTAHPINEYHILLKCAMNGAEAPRARLKQDVEAAVGDWAWKGTQDEIAGRLLSADGVWAATPGSVSQDARSKVTTATIAFLESISSECWSRKGQPAGPPHNPATVVAAGAAAGEQLGFNEQPAAEAAHQGSHSDEDAQDVVDFADLDAVMEEPIDDSDSVTSDDIHKLDDLMDEALEDVNEDGSIDE